MQKIVLTVFVLLLFMVPDFLFSQPGKMVAVGVYQNPPKVYLDEKGEPRGFFVDLIKEIARLEEWQVRFNFDTWSENLRKLEDGRIDLMPDVAFTEARVQKYSLNRETVISDWFQVYGKSREINSILDLKGIRVAILAESIQLDFFKNLIKNLGYHCEIVERQDYESICAAVRDGDADVMLSNRFAGKVLGPKYGLKETSVIFNPTSLHFAARKNANQEILQRIDARLNDWKERSDSFYFQTLHKNLSEKTEFVLPTWLKNLLWSLLLIILFILATVLVFRRQLDQRTSELRIANDKLVLAMQELKEAHEKAVNQERLNALGQMASGIAHDFNNILTPITGFTELLIEADDMLEDREKLKDYLKTILSAGNDGVELVKRMKAFYRQQEATLEKADTDLNQLVDAVVKLTVPRWKEQTQSEGRPVSVETDFTENCRAQVCPSQIRGMLVNLIFNAVDAMPQGGTIKIATFKKDGNPGIILKDSGTGMNPEVLNNCFSAFYTTKGERGTGIGLSMVKEICESHNAVLSLDSELGKGTEFTIVFADAEVAAPQAVDKKRQVVGRQLKILAVDDDARVLSVTKALLSNDGHNVVCCERASEALNLALSQDFDLIISDYSMPEHTGLSLVQEIRKRKPLQKFIVVSGSNIERAMAELDRLNVQTLEKPLKLSRLNQCIASLFHHIDPETRP